jgi:succinoglycan biosynthesis transport protein ExoP
MTSWLQNDIINKLRQQYVDTARREADYVVRLGPEHQAVVTARKELRQIERAAAEELRRIDDSWKGDYDIAQARLRAAEAQLKAGTEQNAGNRQEQGALQVLESAARTYQGLHDTFLQRYIEANQQQNFTATEARMISSAASGLKIQPNSQQVLGLGAVLGLMLGCGAAYARDRANRVFRTSRELEQTLGVECLGILPAIEVKTRGAKEDPDAASRRIISQDLGIARQVVLTPFSRFTETVRSVKVAADTSGLELKVIGLVSAVPGEGKSTVSSNLAQLAAHAGTRTLLIDADLRQPSLTRQMAPSAASGLLQVLEGTAKLQQTVWHDPVTGLDFLPAAFEAPIAHTSEILSSRRMAELVAEARELYDYVVIDFPPLAPVVDAKAAAHLVDGFILVVEWGQTSPEIVIEALSSAEVVQSKLIGAVLNRANAGMLRKLETYKGKNYHRYYATYGAAA